MPFWYSKFESPEKIVERKEEEREGEEKLKNLMKEIAERLKKDGIPTTESCRIDMEAYKKIYTEETINKDKELIAKREKEWKEDFKEEKKIGRKLERLKTAIFSKFLGEEFVVVRASLYDDIKNKVDNIIFNKENGNIICAFDEVGEAAGERYEKKKKEVLERNLEGGGHLKYGLKLEKDKENQKKIVLGQVTNIPIFYLALPTRHIEEGINRLSPSFEEKSEYEKNLFTYFTTSLSAQINFLKLEKNLNPTLKDRLNYFEECLQRFKREK